MIVSGFVPSTYSHLNRTTFLWEYESWIMSDISNKEVTPVNFIET